MQDFTLISVPWMLQQRVTTFDADGCEVADTGEYQRQGAETVFIFAEFMKTKALLLAGVEVERRPDLELKFSDLTSTGQQFARFALDKWMRSLERTGPSKPVTDQGLERLWSKFLVTQS
ncbi:hypothetical protein [Brevundimonas sp.]|uniref:hypothetical protein n=1 Tax=Brevundimonas sp. TaxID=1871086 RepID=UPI0035B38ADA